MKWEFETASIYKTEGKCSTNSVANYPSGSSVGIVVGSAEKKAKQQERKRERERDVVDVKVAVREKLRDAWRSRVGDAEK